MSPKYINSRNQDRTASHQCLFSNHSRSLGSTLVGKTPEEGVAAPLSVLIWRILWTVEPVGLQSVGSQSRTGEMAAPLQYSCLENPMERGACRAAVRGVTQSQTRLSDSHFHFADVRFPYGNS